MNNRLWLNGLEYGVAADQYAIDWRDAMQKRYPKDHVHIEPVPCVEVTFPVGDAAMANRSTRVTRSHRLVPALPGGSFVRSDSMR